MKDIPFDMWEPVIGLEIHAQLNTKSKLFSKAANRFGDEPNVNINEVCTAQPGALPLLNKAAVEKAVRFGLAIGGTISQHSVFERKSYFYPDLPKNFQITQYKQPIILGGEIIADVGGESMQFSINRAHLEDDAGMLKHFTSFAGVDFNRAGVPLLEIVSEPCIFSTDAAVAYATTIKAILEYVNASDCNMEEGSLRIDANISLRPKGDKTLRTKTEIKNMNSFSFMKMALESEIKRQISLYTSHPHEDWKTVIEPGTYRWDAEKKTIILMRKKESAEDYRYFPEPDLPPIILSNDYIAKIQKNLPELPHQRFSRYVSSLQLSEYNASVLINEKKLSDYFEEALKTTPHATALCNWITVEFGGRIKELGKDFFSLKIPPQHIASLVNMIHDNTITGKIAKNVADDMVKNPMKDPKKIVQENPDYQPLDDKNMIETFVDMVLEENPQSILDFRNGKDKAFAFLVGQVMKKTRGKASPQIVNDLLRKKIVG
ncbi:MAG: Asp-tRNA(Asn)/Glu-tRNA(Gln) amidotransferase subunit GatB [Parachlamydiales bacterium]|nr:Asp-tRNA(Asn)/Glu-tRNA(Gln) amidotransferase subunit GatB [Parachlamydiales bacterium]